MTVSVAQPASIQDRLDYLPVYLVLELSVCSLDSCFLAYMRHLYIEPVHYGTYNNN